jgi:hypothetical protein
VRLVPGYSLLAACRWLGEQQKASAQRRAASDQPLFHKQRHNFKLIHIDQSHIGQF